MPEDNKAALRRLYRSEHDRILFGVCTGLAEYLEVDPQVVRILWLISTLVFGLGIFFYIAAAFIIPKNPEGSADAAAPRRRRERNSVVGALFIALGVLILLDVLGVFRIRITPLNFVPWRLFWPATLIGLGVFFIVSGEAVGKIYEDIKRAAESRRLYRNAGDRMIVGVCSGLGDYYEVDPTVVRLIFVVVAIATSGVAVLAYAILGIVMPTRKAGSENTGPL